MDIIREDNAPVESLNPDWFRRKVAGVDVLRLDMVHPLVSGNKWYKLKYNLQYAKSKNYREVVTFGGAYSNHLLATAVASKYAGLKSFGFVRGKYAQHMITPTLTACREYGMQLSFETKEDYHSIKERTSDFSAIDETLVIAEGGANELGRKGAGEIAFMIDPSYSHVCVSVGTGTTLIGLRNALPLQQKLLGFVPMKNGNYLNAEITDLLSENAKCHLLFDKWHFGGFGKWNEVLITFLNGFYQLNNIPLDVVYTGKMMFGVRELIHEDYFPSTAKILCIHTGGLQGNSVIASQLVY